jgi:hypothetical protein
MLGLKSFSSAAITIHGVELTHRIRKGQFDLRAHSGANSVRNLGSCPGCLTCRALNPDQFDPISRFAPDPY